MRYSSLNIPIACLRSIHQLTDEQAGKVFKGIVLHALDSTDITDAGIMQPIIDTINAFIDEAEQHRQHISTVRSVAGKQGGRPHKPAPTATAPEAPPSASKFIKPTPEQTQEYIDAYAKAHNLPSFPAQKFIDYQDSIGWIVGKTKKPMKDWQAAVRTWFRNNADEQDKPQQGREIINNKEFSQF